MIHIAPEMMARPFQPMNPAGPWAPAVPLIGSFFPVGTQTVPSANPTAGLTPMSLPMTAWLPAPYPIDPRVLQAVPALQNWGIAPQYIPVLIVGPVPWTVA